VVDQSLWASQEENAALHWDM
jgi:hypothetical protein